MKRTSAVFITLSYLCVALLAQPSVSSQKIVDTKLRYADGEVLVKLKLGARAFESGEPLADRLLAGRAARVEPLEVAGKGGLFLCEIDRSLSVQEAIATALQDPRVEYAEPNYLIRPAETVPNDEFFNLMWGLSNNGANSGAAGADIAATRVWDITQGSQDVVVAVVDTGADLTHPDLAPNAWVNRGEVASNGVDDDRNGFVDDINGWNFLSNSNRLIVNAQEDFHGTHVSGIIGASGNNGTGVTGVAWQVKLMSLKFIGDKSGSTSDAVRAINYAITQRQKGVNVRVINASWGGGGGSQSLQNAIAAAGQAGILFVCAAGNGGDDSRGDNIDEQPDYPASWASGISSIVSVAALDSEDRLASFSNYGLGNVSVGAPGVRVLSTVVGGSYGFASGTSMSAPFVSGIAALIWSQEPSLTPAQVRQRIISTGDPVASLASKAVNPVRANAYNAIARTTPAIENLTVGSVKATKKVLTVDGLGFVSNSTIVEVNGTALSGTKYDRTFEISNGTLTRLTVKLGKPKMNEMIPRGLPVTITVFDRNSGARSSGYLYVRN